MSKLILPEGLTRGIMRPKVVPAFPVRLDRSNPFAKDLVHCYLCNHEVAHNIAIPNMHPKLIPLTHVDNPYIDFTEHGSGLHGARSDGEAYYKNYNTNASSPDNVHRLLGGATSVSVLAVFKATIDFGSGNFFTIGRQMAFQPKSGTPDQMQLHIKDTDYQTTGRLGLMDAEQGTEGELNVGIATWDTNASAADEFKFYLNGESKAWSISGTPGFSNPSALNTPGANDPISFGNHGDYGSPAGHSWQFCAMAWKNRVLTEKEAKDLTADPYQLLMPADFAGFDALNLGAPPPPAADNSVPWMSFF